MKLHIIKIGNSLGPDDNGNPRAVWGEAFKKMAQAGDDTLFDATVLELEFDRKEWKW